MLSILALIDERRTIAIRMELVDARPRHKYDSRALSVNYIVRIFTSLCFDVQCPVIFRNHFGSWLYTRKQLKRFVHMHVLIILFHGTQWIFCYSITSRDVQIDHLTFLGKPGDVSLIRLHSQWFLVVWKTLSIIFKESDFFLLRNIAVYHGLSKLLIFRKRRWTETYIHRNCFPSFSDMQLLKCVLQITRHVQRLISYRESKIATIYNRYDALNVFDPRIMRRLKILLIKQRC